MIWGCSRITDVIWRGPNAVEVSFETSLTNRYWQLYVNRRLAGVTESVTARSIIGSVMPASRATPLHLAGVSLAERMTSFGSRMSVFPFNRYRVSWAAPSDTTDLKRFDVVMGTAAGESYDPSNVVGSVDYQAGVSAYSFDLPAFDQTGEWSVAVIGRDRTTPLGNAGDALATTIAATVFPIDFAQSEPGRRFEVSTSNGVLTASFNWGAA